MAVPNLLNPILIEISQIDEDSTVYHDIKHEPANFISYETSFKINVQIFFGRQEYLEPASSGPTNNQNLTGMVKIADGYIIVRTVDLIDKGKTLSTGNKIINYGNIGMENECEYYLIGKKDAAHYSDQGKPTLEKWFFADRN